MAFSVSGFPEGLVREMLEGIVEEETAFADSVMGRKITERSAMSGRIPIRGTTGGVGRGENRALAPLEEAKAYAYNVTFAQYNAAAYVGYGLLSDEEKNDAGYFFNEDALGLEMRTARRDANTGLDRDFDTLISSTSLNTEFDVTSNGGTWSGVSTMAANLRTLREVTSPGATDIIIGRAAKNIMSDNDDFLATPIGGNAYAGGSGEEQLLAEWLKRYCGYTNVHFFERLKNTAGIGATAALGYHFDLGVWVGYADDLVMVSPQNDEQNSLEIERVTRKRATEIQFTRYDDMIRPTLLKGATVTNLT